LGATSSNLSRKARDAITRAGQPADHLSEGEKTAIAFLYFLNSLQDKGFSLENDIVVIDDPVSSLDANALFSAFGYMKERSKEAGQLFILTHNFAFFRQVKNWFLWINGGPSSQKKDAAKLVARSFMLDCEHLATGRNARILQLDPLLWEYESEYHYLFKKVHEGSVRAPGEPLETYYGLPNIARRLLEAFLSFRYPNRSGLRAQLDKLKCDPAVRARVIRFVHTYSHEGAGGEEHDPTILAETPAILREILNLVEEEDQGHYREMLAVIGITAPIAAPIATAAS
jgi:wobble nucleotide-excising tRNase